MTYRCCRHCRGVDGTLHHNQVLVDTHPKACTWGNRDAGPSSHCTAGVTQTSKPRLRIMLEDDDTGDWWWVLQIEGEDLIWLQPVSPTEDTVLILPLAQLLNWAIIVTETAA